ncbi:urease accessory protein UreF [Shumkonia mesophila]|uniref:urease accessory protein UreF n=1 Tax=Shumkonia mesophila TaxID=2838854 RepID=UPI00293470F7|nr:urease accessory protein UreF [Shumkonia mesophila]
MIDGAILLRLMAWLSPSFPIGGYTYSHGIEYAVEAGLIKDADGLAVWIEGVLSFGAGRLDADFFRAAWTAVDAGDGSALADAVGWADALRGSAEAALESRSQGQAFLDTVRAVWPDPWLDAWAAELAEATVRPAHAVAVAAAAARLGAPLRESLVVYLHAFAANLVSAGVRLIPLGQTDGQRTIARLEAAVIAAAAAALSRPWKDLGGAAVMADWTSMKHETQYTRLFRS